MIRSAIVLVAARAARAVVGKGKGKGKDTIVDTRLQHQQSVQRKRHLFQLPLHPLVPLPQQYLLLLPWQTAPEPLRLHPHKHRPVLHLLLRHHSLRHNRRMHQQVHRRVLQVKHPLALQEQMGCCHHLPEILLRVAQVSKVVFSQLSL